MQGHADFTPPLPSETAARAELVPEPLPPLFLGGTAVVLGGGPSLTLADVALVHAWSLRAGSECGAIAINSAWLAAPWARVLVGCDLKWWTWPHGRLALRAFGGLMVSQDARVKAGLDGRVHWVESTGVAGYDDDPRFLRTGRNGGYQATHMAAQMGARRIVLLGLDMSHDGAGRTHWHDGHPLPPPPEVYRTLMLEHWPSLAAALAARGVEVINATPGGLLEAFPRRPLREALA
jgi:hypothetical protein